MVATVGFVGSAGAKLYWARNINLPDPGPGAVDPRRPYAVNLTRASPGSPGSKAPANSFFSSMQTTLREALQQRLVFPWQLDLVPSASTMSAATAARTGPIPQDPRNRRADWASSNSDVRHRVNLAATYQLPFGPGRPFATGGGALGQIIGGWEIGGIAVLQSGLPFTVTVPGSPSNTGNGSRANPVAGVESRFRLTRTSICGSIQRPSLHLRHLHGERSDEIR